MKIGNLLVLGAVGYGVYEYLTGGWPFGPAVATTSTAAGGIIPATTPAPVAAPTTTRGLIQAAATKDNFTMGNADEWGYYYAQVRGVPAPNPGGYLSADVGNEKLTLGEWCTASGLCGYRRA